MTIYLDPMDELNTIVHKIRTAPDPRLCWLCRRKTGLAR